LRLVRGALSDAGAELVLIGSGRPDQALQFREATGLDQVRILVDPGLDSYRAAGLHRGILRTLGPRAMKNALRARRAGHRQRGVKGDPWQHGGTLIISPKGEVLFHHRSQRTGDHAVGETLTRKLD